MASGYDTLQQAVTEAQRILAEEKSKLAALQNDAEYVRVMAILNDSRVRADSRSWIDAGGTFWTGNDAAQEHQQGQSFVNNQQGKIAAQQAVVNDAQRTLDSAKKDLIEYEQQSPVGQQAAVNAGAMSKANMTVIYSIIGLAFIIVLGIIIGYIEKENKIKIKIKNKSE